MTEIQEATPAPETIAYAATTALVGADKETFALASTLSGKMTAVAVKSNEDYENATTQLKEIKEAAKKLEEVKKKMLAPFNAAVTSIREMFKAPETALTQAEQHLKQSALAFYTEQERLRKKQEEEQRQALLKIEQEKREREERERREAEQRRLDAEKAAADNEFSIPSFDDEPAPVPAPAPAPIVGELVETLPPPVTAFLPKASGISVRKTWVCKVVNPELLPREFTMPNEKALAAYAESMKDKAKLPGCEFEEVSSMAAGRGRKA